MCIAVAVGLYAVTRPKPAAPATQSGAAANPSAAAPADWSWTNGMVWIPGGTFMMGANTSGVHPVTGQPIDASNGSLLLAQDEQPVHRVTVKGFWMDQTEVTNEQFEKFTKATGYLTIAERKPDPKFFPELTPEEVASFQPGSIVFRPPPGEVPLWNHRAWWAYVPGANWRHPDGPESDLKGREKHPVVHVCWFDVAEYCKWAGKRLPTEAEWEFAARGGLEAKKFTWGDEQFPGGKTLANFWQGNFPNGDSKQDGFHLISPVASYAPNGYGLHDMAGNVWEWVSDWYRHDYYAMSPENNPQGPDTSYDPNEPNSVKKVTRGGSFLCSDLYCSGYRPSARMKSTPDTGLSHTGFRCVKDGPPPPAK
ncbi:MAG: formylglycine-generating enzyme family protein [Verrucomicrobiota bacterium]